MSAELRIMHLRDEDDFGQLVATVKSGTFAGTGWAYFCREQVERFIQSLRACPLAADHLPKIEGGYWNKEQRDKLDECHLRVAVRPFNLRGQLMVIVDLATELPTNTGRDHQQTISARFRTDYAELHVFASELLAVLEGKREDALLPGMSF
jgi:hypothetical protein